MVEALRACRGIQLIHAVRIVAELGDLARFTHPRQLMGYLGLIPSEDSSAERRRDEGAASYRRVAAFDGPNMLNSMPGFGRPKWGIYKPAFAESDFDGPRIGFHDEIIVEKLN